MYDPAKIADLFSSALPSQPLPSFPEPDAFGRVLIEAAHAIRTRGHTQHELVSDDGRLCMIGAINFVRTGSAEFQADYGGMQYTGRVADFLFGRTSHTRAVMWNNAPERTAAEVIAALEDAAFFSTPTS